jgi:hypothetical protein
VTSRPSRRHLRHIRLAPRSGHARVASRCPFSADSVITQCDAKCGYACYATVAAKDYIFHGVPEEANASIPATAHSTSCSSVAPATPSAPSTWPARMMGRPPGRLMSGAPSPMTVAARKYSEPSIDLSPLGRPDLAETNAFPIDARLASASAPSIRWRAMRRPSASQTVTLMLTARLCALARAAWMARFASASLIDMSFAWMDRFQYCVLAFWRCCQCFTITRAGGDRCAAEFRLDLYPLRVKSGKAQNEQMLSALPPKADTARVSWSARG